MASDRLNPGWPVLAQLRNLLPLDDDSLQQVINYAVSLPRNQAADHLKNLLGDSDAALDFISNFNSKRIPFQSSSQPAPSINVMDDGSIAPVPKATGPKKAKKKFSELNKLPPPRQIDGHGNVQGAYMKNQQNDYMRATAPPKSPVRISSGPSSSLDVTPSGSKSVTPAREASPAPTATKAGKLPPSAAGSLITDLPKTKTKSKTTKVNITGGLPMQGASTALSDLDSAIRALEIQTNPTLALSAKDNERRGCNCMATRHPLLEAAPNCLHCGKIVCVKEGIGPCTFCGSPLLDPESIEGMIRVLREERGREKQALGNASHRRAEISKAPRPFATPKYDSGSEAEGQDGGLSAAEKHRDKLLAFQSQNAKRTTIRDEAADFDTPTAGLNMWASPVERAMQLKRQQKALREQEWNARPDWDRKQVVVSIDIVKGKAVKRTHTVNRPRTPETDEEELLDIKEPTTHKDSKASFGKNPLLGALIRPVAKVNTKDKDPATKNTSTRWRRVQDDNSDNERWILDGGLHGNVVPEPGNADEPPCG